MRFVVDENLPVDIAQLLEARGHEVTLVGESRLRGSSDEELWAVAIETHSIMVTRDLDFPLRNAGKPAGLIIMRVPSSWRRGQISQLFELFLASDEGPIEGKLIVITPGRVRQRNL